MTFCAGWKYEGFVFLLADSAITGPAPIISRQSSFGEIHRPVRGENVQEGLLKLAPIGDNAAIAFAGDVELARQIVEFLIAHWASFRNNLQDLQASLDATFGPFNPTIKVAFLLALWSDEGTILARWQSGQGFLEHDCESCSIGSLGQYHRDFTDAVVRELVALGIPLESMLPAVTALVQSYGIHDNMLDQNVGGTVFGLRVGPPPVRWQTDTGYMIYSRENQTVDFIMAWARDNALMVHSSLTRETIAMMNSAVRDYAKWFAVWNPRIDVEIRSDHFPTVVFIRREDKLITILERSPNRDGLMRLRFDGEDLHVDMTAELDEMLQQDLDQSAGAPAWRLTYRRDQ